MENQVYFTPNDVSHITEVTKRTLHYYHEIELLVPTYIASNGYRYYSSKDISKLQTIQFLRELNLSLADIQLYFSNSIEEKNIILENNYQCIVAQRDQLNKMIHFLNHHLVNHRKEEINMSKWNNDNIQHQYEKEAEMKYSHTHYYQAFKENQKRLNSTEKQQNNKRTMERLHSFFDKMNELFIANYKINHIQVKQAIFELKDILRTQVPNVDEQFLEYIASIYENDERFAKTINNKRHDNLNQYIADAIRNDI
ncbi:MerR family transcriptional regulator [Staphylococcus hominis]|uniref:MerR family transcriptional regulator n=1 Tax=Staphylococcus hominis TaxID=1290 RepID=UPI000D1F793B|nr:MerR family transcriptional regulator [Staphylococcus hominis]PTK38748.1 MerR family transcriptional regulator [Staphylococcus hominis]RIO48921.1 MerR family transcriptional regulator [Staphylococcus hominis]